jgi:hypothetical protein
LEELEDNANVFPSPARQAVLAHCTEFLPGKEDPATRGAINPGEHIQDGRLPAA